MTGIVFSDLRAKYPLPNWLLRPQIAIVLLLTLCCFALAIGLVLRALSSRGSEPPSLSADAQAFGTDDLRGIAFARTRNFDQSHSHAASHNSTPAPFTPALAASSERLKAIDCLANVIYYEAGAESEAGQRAVAQVVLNRVRHVGYPNSVCGVVYQGSERSTGCQFTFTCDGSLARRPEPSGWSRAQRLARAAIFGEVFVAVGRALNYHADYVVPYWSASLVKSAVIGSHVFYLSPGNAGDPAAFTARYSGIEPDLRPGLRSSDADRAHGTVFVAESNFAEGGAFRRIPEPPVADVPEARARELDRFALLDYKTDKQPASTLIAADLPFQIALSSALGGVPKQDDPSFLQKRTP